MSNRVDVAVVGAGILGLAFAWEAARRGKSVAVFERDARAQGASIRNFGMVWPIGQPPGEAYRTALRSRERWLKLAKEKVLWLAECGSLHVAHEADEDAVLREFAETAPGQGLACEYLGGTEAQARFPAIQVHRLQGALFSKTELAVDPRQAIAEIPKYLASKHGVQFHHESTVVEATSGTLRTSRGESWAPKQTIIASGIDFETLFPEVYRTSGIRKCKLHMLRTPPQPNGWKLGPHLAGGLTLAHYKSFEVCRSLPALKQRIAETMPEYVKYGIHVMASQNELGEVIIGDSHEYGADISIFNSERIDSLILGYLKTILELPDASIAARWHGFYAKHPAKPLVIESPCEGVTIVAAPGGAGMTMSFGYAADWWDKQ